MRTRPHRVYRPRDVRHFWLVVSLLGLSLAASAQVSVLTSKNDNYRSGLNSGETLLSSTSVNVGAFGKLGTMSVDGYVQAQALYYANLSINGGTHNVVFVATMHDSVFAFDADTGQQYWQTSFINPASGVTTVSSAAQGCTGVTGFNEIGILSTPVIDAVTGVLYVTAKTAETSGSTTSYVYRLHGLSLSTGAETAGSPVVLGGTADGLTFAAQNLLQRPALLLSNGTLYVGFGSNGCDLNARGWVMAYNESTLQQSGILVTQPDNNYGSSVWQSGTGPAADSSGYVYFVTANGLFNNGATYPDLGDSVVKMSLGASGLSVADYFTPFDQANMAANDLDLGSAGVLMLPDQTGTYPHLMIATGKPGNIYVVNRDNLGQYNSASNNQIPQYIPSALGELHGNPAYWNNYVYFLAQQDNLKAYSLTNGVLSNTPAVQTPGRLTTVALPVISANGNSGGIVWLVRNVKGTPLMSAYDALTLTLLYDSGMAAGGRDSLGVVPHFGTPTVANGKVYMGTQTQLVVYGLFPTLTASAGNNQSTAVGTTLASPLSVVASNPYTGAPYAGVTVTFSDGGKGGHFSNPTAVTDSTGTASTYYTVPTTPQTLTITATNPAYTSASLTETAVVGPVTAMSLISGGKQTGTVGTTLPAAIVFKAKDTYGNPVPGVSITYSDGGKGGSFSANPVVTNSSGQASSSYTLPTKAQSLTIKGTYGSVSASASESAVAGSPAALNIVSGNNQTAHPNTKLSRALVVSVTDSYGNPLSGVTVSYTDNGAGGAFNNPTQVTNSSGQASATYTTPPQTGTVTISTNTATLGPTNFTVTVQ
jgi:hypothetical protein